MVLFWSDDTTSAGGLQRCPRRFWRVFFEDFQTTERVMDLLADPDRVCASFHGDSRKSKITEALVHSGRVGSETASVDDLAVFVERAEMAPDVPKVDPDRYPGPGTVPSARSPAARPGTSTS
jgi:hypothetical protein